MSDDLTVLGPDGIRRSYDEHYDTMMDVEQDPTGAWQAIQTQHYRIEELEAKLVDAEWLLIEAVVQLREGKIKTRKNRADLINAFLEELKGAD